MFASSGTGLGPKQLKGGLQLLPGFVLTALLLGIDGRTAGYSWPMRVAVAIIGGALVGMPGAKLLHDTAQRVGRRLLGGSKVVRSDPGNSALDGAARQS